MKKNIIGLLVLCSCFTRPNVASRSSFDSIDLGAPVSEVEKKVGKPYQVRRGANGTTVYEYIERISSGDNEVLEENHYFFTFKNGAVVSKNINQLREADYDQIYDDDPNDVELQ